MFNDIEKLPNNPSELKDVILSLNTSHLEEKQQLNLKIELLEEKQRYLLHKLYGRKSEKQSLAEEDGQMRLFDEAEHLSNDSKDDEEDEPTPSKAPKKRKKKERKAIPDHLPFTVKEHDISAEEKQCACGCELSRIGQEECNKIEITPPKIEIIKHVRYKYACKSCEGLETEGSVVKIAPPPLSVIPKSFATGSLLAYIIISKFADALPYYRQEKILERFGINISRETMSSWMIKVANLLIPLLSLLKKELLSGPLINIDETKVQVLGELGRKNTSESRMWAFRGGTAEKPVIIFHYHPTRAGKVPQEYIDGYEGCIQTDDYAGYDRFDKMTGIVHIGCWAHARRKFDEVIKAAKKNKNNKKNKTGKAGKAMAYIKKLYEVETKCKNMNLSYDEVKKERQQNSQPVLDKFKYWLDEVYPTTPPKGLLGKAISYTLNNWRKLYEYTNHGHVPMDNNLIENAIRPFVIGRKNWLFSGSPKGAESSALLYSLIETAKANGLEPYAYFRFILEKLPAIKSNSEFTSLMPQNINVKEFEIFCKDFKIQPA